MNKEELTIASNETILELLKYNKEQCKIIRKIFTTFIVAQVLIVFGILGAGLYFLNTFEVETFQEEVVVEGEDAQYNNIKGDNNSIVTSKGGDK